MESNEQMQVDMVEVGVLRASEYNPRKLDKEAKERIRESLTKFGFVEPIVVNSAENRKNVIIGGHQRFLIAKEMGFALVPVHYVSIQDLDRERELNLRLNKNSGDWDWDLLKLFSKDELITAGFSEKEVLKEIGDGEPEQKAEVEFTQELLEQNNYVVLFFRNEIDWLNAQSVLKLETVKALDSKEGYEKKGVGRVVDGIEAFKRIKES